MALLREVKLNGRNYEIHYLTGTVIDEKLWAILVAQDTALFAFGMLASPFVGFYGTRRIVRNIAQKRADEYIEADPDGLMRTIKETRNETSPGAKEASRG